MGLLQNVETLKKLQNYLSNTNFGNQSIIGAEEFILKDTTGYYSLAEDLGGTPPVPAGLDADTRLGIFPFLLLPFQTINITGTWS